MSNLTLLGVGGTSFNPNLIANLEWWLDASDTTTVFSDKGGTTPLTTTGLIGRINDKSGNGHHGQVTSSQKPTWTVNSQNGRAGIDASNSGYFDTIANTTSLASTVSVFFVGNVPAAAAFHGVFDGDFSSFFPRYDSAAKQDTVLSGQTDIGQSTSAVPTAVASLGVWQYDATNGCVWRNNGTGNGTHIAGGTAGGMTTTVLSASNGTNLFLGVMYELIVYKRVLTASEITYIENGLNAKWNIY